MQKIDVMNGNKAAAVGVALVKPDVVAAHLLSSI